MSGTLEFLLSPEERSFLKAAKKSMYAQGLDGAALFNSNLPIQMHGFPAIDYSQKTFPDVLHDLISLVSSHVREFSGSRA